MSTELRVLTWNVFGSPVARDPIPKMRRLARFIEDRGYDLVLLQEVWTAEQLAVFEALPGFDALSRTRDRWWLVPRKGGLLTLSRRDSPWRVRSLEFIEFDAEACDAFVWQGDGVADKGVQRMVVENERAGMALVMLNTHLQAPYGPRFLFGYEDVRAAQLAELEKIARSVEGRMTVLAAGDLNLSPDTGNYRVLTRFWTDLSMEERQTCQCGTHEVEKGDPPEWIDYLLARPGPSIEVTAEVSRLDRCGAGRDQMPPLRECSDEEEKAERFLSDHNGLEAKVRFERSDASRAIDAGLVAALVTPSTRRRLLALVAAVALRGLIAPRTLWSIPERAACASRSRA